MPHSLRRHRTKNRQKGAEGGIWSVVIALSLSGLLIIIVGCIILSRENKNNFLLQNRFEKVSGSKKVKFDQFESDKKERILKKLRALKINRQWFMSLLEDSLTKNYNYKGFNLSNNKDNLLQKNWINLSETWLSVIELLPLSTRIRLGSLSDSDWENERFEYIHEDVPTQVIVQLITAGTRYLFPEDIKLEKLQSPYIQLWHASAKEIIPKLPIIDLQSSNISLDDRSVIIEANSACLIGIEVPKSQYLNFKFSESPLLQMTVYNYTGKVISKTGPLKAIDLNPFSGTKIYVVISNDGVSSSAMYFNYQINESESVI